MTRLELADLVLVASRVLAIDTDATLDLLDTETAEKALAEAQTSPEPAGAAAGLLVALVRDRPFRRGNERIALIAAAQLLAMNGRRLDIGEPDEAKALLADVAAGRLDAADVAVRLRGSAAARSISKTVRQLLRGREGQMFERFTDRARRVVSLAQEEARERRHDHIGTEHLLLALIHDGDGVAADVLTALGISSQDVRHEVDATIGRGEAAPKRGHIPFTPRAKKVLELSLREAVHLGHNYIGTEHILLGLIREGQGVAADVLIRLGADLDRVREGVTRRLGQPVPSPAEEIILLRREIGRIWDVLRAHGIEPDEGESKAG